MRGLIVPGSCGIEDSEVKKSGAVISFGFGIALIPGHC